MAEKPTVDPLMLIMEKLTLLENSVKQLNQENGKRAQEIAALAQHNDLIETEDDSTSCRQIGNSKNLREKINDEDKESTSSNRSPSSERRQNYRKTKTAHS